MKKQPPLVTTDKELVLLLATVDMFPNEVHENYSPHEVDYNYGTVYVYKYGDDVLTVIDMLMELAESRAEQEEHTDSE